MAVVSKTEEYFGKMRTMKVVKFSSRERRFKIQLPSGARDSCGEYVYGETLDEVNKAYIAASTKYLNSSIKEEKVIVVSFEGECCIVEDGKIVFECDRGYSSGSDGLTIELNCAVFIKQTWTCPNGDSTDKYDETEHSIPESASYQWAPSPSGSGSIEIPWTKEREQFFTDLINATQQIIRKLSEFTTNAKSVLKFADRGLKFLPSAKNETKQKRRKL